MNTLNWFPKGLIYAMASIVEITKTPQFPYGLAVKQVADRADAKNNIGMKGHIPQHHSIAGD